MGFSGSFARCPLSAISGHHHEGIIGLPRREIHNSHSSMPCDRCSVCTTTPCPPSAPLWRDRPIRPFPQHAVARRPLPRRAHDRVIPDRPGRARTLGCRHPEPGHACPGVPRQARPQPRHGGEHQCRARRQEDQRPHGHDTRRSRRRHLSAGRNRPTGCQTSLRERLADHGSRPAQGQGHRLSMARRTCPMLWLGSSPMRPRHGAGRMSSPPGTSP
jgi:hypothetical protein